MISFLQKSDIQLIILTILLVIISLSGLYFGNWITLLLPLVIFFIGVLVFKADLLFFLLPFLIPLSINPSEMWETMDLSLSIPVEPLLAIFVFAFFYLLFSHSLDDKRIFTHPFAIIIYIYLSWIFITSLSSTEKIVSIKFLIAKLWFIIPSFFLAYFYFKAKGSKQVFLSLFVISLSIVALYNIIHLWSWDFAEKPSQWTMKPFFKDHTIFGAVLGMGVPLAFGMAIYHKLNLKLSLLYYLCFVVLMVGLYLTYSRAAWISIVASLFYFFLFVLRIKFKTLMFGLGLLLVYILINQNNLIRKLEENKVSSSNDFVENVESISNISSDQSNLERLNRWYCAIAMGKAKPVFGFGPGTYMFHYAPFQLSSMHTEISTNFGDVGNAHSEYLGPFAEMGILGLCLMIVLLIGVIYYSFKSFYQSHDQQERIIILAVSCSLIGYFTHGFLNNFLDSDKAAVIFWAMICIIITKDIQTRHRSKDNSHS